MKNEKIPFIIDVDTGIDDAVALVFGANLKNLDLKLVSTIYGNTNLLQTTKNTLVILEDVNRPDIPVVKGEEKSLENNDYNVSVHGKNGLANYTHETKIKELDVNYIDKYHEVINKYSHIFVIACGPLTNLAKYLMAHPEDNEKMHLIIVTGLLEIDKDNPYINFNIAKDVTACEYVLKNYKHITIVPSDLGHWFYIPENEFVKTKECGRIGEILANLYPYHMDRTVKNGAALHDLCGVLWLSNPELFTTRECFCSLIHTEKGSYLDFDFYSKTPNVEIATGLNIEAVQDIYYQILKDIK